MSGVYPRAVIIHKGDWNVTVEQLNDELFSLHIPALIFVALCMVVGIVGNLFVMAIYKTKFRRSNHRYFILFLAVIDLLASCVAMPFVMASLRLPYLTTSDAVCKINRCILYYLNNASGLMVVAISVERFRKICHPFKKQLTHRQTLYICFGVVTFSAVMAVPAAVLYAANPIATGVANITCHQCSISQQVTPIFRVYLVTLMLETTASICAFAVLYSFIIRTLWKNDQFLSSMRRRKATSSSSTRVAPQPILSHEEIVEVDHVEKLKESHNSSADDFETTSSSGTLSRTNDDKMADSFGSNDAENMCNSCGSDVNIHEESKDTFIKRHTYDTNTNTKLEYVNGHGKRTFSDPTSINFPMSSQVAGLTFCKSQSKKASRRQTAAGKRSIHRRAGKHSRSTTRVTLMLLTVSVFFAVAYIPHLVLIYIVSADRGFLDSLSGTQLIVFQVFLRSFFINNVVNPIIYYVFDSKFRKLSKEVFKSFSAQF